MVVLNQRNKLLFLNVTSLSASLLALCFVQIGVDVDGGMTSASS
jgi:hypothetical protein